MSNLEDIFRSKLENWSESLPEGSLSDFRSRLDESRRGSRKQQVLPVLYVLPVLAACVIALLLILKPEPVSAPSVDVVAQVVPESDGGEMLGEKALSESLVLAEDALTQTLPETIVPPVENLVAQVAEEDEGDVAQVVPEADVPAEDYENLTMVKDDGGIVIPDDTSYGQREVRSSSPKAVKRATRRTIGTTIVGSVLLSSIPESTKDIDPDVNPMYTSYLGSFSKAFDRTPYQHMPFKTFASVRYRLSDRLSLTSGLEYSLYTTSETFWVFKSWPKQYVHYIGVPLRLDFTIAQSEKWEVYAGVGGAADLCIAARVGGKKVNPDEGFTFSAQGAGGVQYNITDRFGIFIEPQLVWTQQSHSQVISTFRTEYFPIVFNVSSGVRFTISK